MMHKVRFRDLGTMPYKEAWDLQEELFNTIVKIKSDNRKRPTEEQQSTEDHLLFVHHPHVYTLGKNGLHKHLLISPERMEQEGIDYYKINRGGDITYHGPGQLVGYPIFNLDHFFPDIHKYLRYLEEAIILTLADYSIEAGRTKGETGVWLDADKPTARKICAMGVRASRWVTMHGFAFNINVDLKYFSYIVPCGIANKGVTSLHLELGYTPDMDQVKVQVRKHLAELFALEYLQDHVEK